jgi:hypothetical protein
LREQVVNVTDGKAPPCGVTAFISDLSRQLGAGGGFRRECLHSFHANTIRQASLSRTPPVLILVQVGCRHALSGFSSEANGVNNAPVADKHLFPLFITPRFSILALGNEGEPVLPASPLDRLGRRV